MWTTTRSCSPTPARKDIRPTAMAEMTRRVNQRLRGARGTLRTHDEITRFFDGLDLLEPASCSRSTGGRVPASPPTTPRSPPGAASRAKLDRTAPGEHSRCLA